MVPSKHSTTRRQRDSWPPTQVRLEPSIEVDDTGIEDLDLSKMDEDPLTFFLTPTPPFYDEDDGMDFEMDFDAGIENAKHPPPIVRSISPSSLGGLSLAPPRPPTPPRSSSTTPDLDRDLSRTPDDIDDDMYLRARAHSFRFPLLLKDLTAGKTKTQPKRYGDNAATSLTPTSSHGPRGSRGRRPVIRPGPKNRRGRSSAVSTHLSPHSWREPSPDVFSIEEETEEELNSEMGDSILDDSEANGHAETEPVDIPAAKPKKKVRFVLPAKDEDEEEDKAH
ncbi:hypothetical protein B0H63DRAFT_307967 [Podospora didyma]|uniref:Uncharacterized protein n=1 Tax=Podospora didyma TaxID=330526 RepID=A0AAE0K5N4_9PEZI|nr:hypothetical protein B0H63DRAFT_307967 [Podospora didyma]